MTRRLLLCALVALGLAPRAAWAELPCLELVISPALPSAAVWEAHLARETALLAERDAAHARTGCIVVELAPVGEHGVEARVQRGERTERSTLALDEVAG